MSSSATSTRLKLLLGTGLLVLLGLSGYFAYEWYAKQADREDGLRFLEQKQWKLAIPKLENYLSHYPNDADVVAGLYRAKMNTSDLLSELEPLANKLCELRPNDPIPFSSRCDLLMRLGRFEAALADGQRCLELSPNDHAVRKSVLNLGIELGRKDVVERESSTLLRNGVIGRAEHGVTMAFVLWRDQDLAGAEKVFAEYVPPDAKTSATLIMGGVLLAERGQHLEAIQRIKSGLPGAKLPDRHIGLTQLVDSYSQLKREEEAREALNELEMLREVKRSATDARQLPQRLDLQIRAARAALRGNETSQAAQILEGAISRGLQSQELWSVLAECYDKLNQPVLAQQARQKASR